MSTTEAETYEARVRREREERNTVMRAALVPLKAAATPLGVRLGGTWTVTLTDKPNLTWPGERVIEIEAVQKKDGETLAYSVEYVRTTKRVVVEAKLPDGVKWEHARANRPRATFDPARGVKGLVASIAKIAGPSALFVSRAVEFKNTAEAEAAKNLANGGRLAKALGVTLSNYHENGKNVQVHRYFNRGDDICQNTSVDAQVYGDNVTLAVRGLPIAVAEKVLALIKKGA